MRHQLVYILIYIIDHPMQLAPSCRPNDLNSAPICKDIFSHFALSSFELLNSSSPSVRWSVMPPKRPNKKNNSKLAVVQKTLKDLSRELDSLQSESYIHSQSEWRHNFSNARRQGKENADRRAREPVRQFRGVLIPKPSGQHHRSSQKGGYSLRAALGLDGEGSKKKYDALLVCHVAALYLSISIWPNLNIGCRSQDSSKIFWCNAKPVVKFWHDCLSCYRAGTYRLLLFIYFHCDFHPGSKGATVLWTLREWLANT